MYKSTLQVRRSLIRFTSDARRVITRLFLPGSEQRIRSVIDRIVSLSDVEVGRLLEEIDESFELRHRDFHGALRRHFDAVSRYIPDPDSLSDERKLVIGAYFTNEYSFESAALFNPSIVPHPNQEAIPEGSIRVLMSLRATGEGHVSSIVFRTGVIDENGEITVAPPSPYARSPHPRPEQINDKESFLEKLIEMGAYNDTLGDLLDMLPDSFTDGDLADVLAGVGRRDSLPPEFEDSARSLTWLAQSDYELDLPRTASPSEIVIFPATENESRGMEDMRLVRFIEEDGRAVYYGIYMAFNGFRVLPQLFATTDFQRINITPLHGRYVQNKGQALFPRRVNGWYMMISRIDGENMYIMRSKSIRFWNEADLLRVPRFPWEYVQIGNCGSPIETDRGWILLTHGVGPIRTYSIGAILLDLNHPSKILGQLREPILAPLEEEREGYVPNVVYTCGALKHNGTLIIPYAMSDSATSFATVDVNELLELMEPVS